MTEPLTTWSQADAVDLCRLVEAIAPHYGYHVALTGGCLYRDGERKDCDLLFYRIRQVKEPDWVGLIAALGAFGLKKVSGWGWCHKAVYRGGSVDMFFPEEVGVPDGPRRHYG